MRNVYRLTMATYETTVYWSWDGTKITNIGGTTRNGIVYGAHQWFVTFDGHLDETASAEPARRTSLMNPKANLPSGYPERLAYKKHL